MSDTSDIPKRIRKPDVINYISLDKETLNDMVLNYAALIKDLLKIDVEINVRLDSYDNVFQTMEQFLSTVDENEWTSLNHLTVYFYSEPYSEYEQVMALDFGGIFYPNAGLQIRYGTKISDIQHLALKQKSDELVRNYERNVPITASLFGWLITLISMIIFIVLFSVNNAFGIDFEKLDLTSTILVIVLISGLASVMFTVIQSFASSKFDKYIPHFETIKRNQKNKISGLNRTVMIFFAWIGGLSGIFAIIDTVYRLLGN